jgi:hypothetical protein
VPIPITLRVEQRKRKQVNSAPRERNTRRRTAASMQERSKGDCGLHALNSILTALDRERFTEQQLSELAQTVQETERTAFRLGRTRHCVAQRNLDGFEIDTILVALVNRNLNYTFIPGLPDEDPSLHAYLIHEASPPAHWVAYIFSDGSWDRWSFSKITHSYASLREAPAFLELVSPAPRSHTVIKVS